MSAICCRAVVDESIIHGAGCDDALVDRLQVAVIDTGFSRGSRWPRR